MHQIGSRRRGQWHWSLFYVQPFGEVRGEADAVAVLKAMIEQEIYPLKYEVKEPSLQEIFVRSVEASERGNVK